MLGALPPWSNRLGIVILAVTCLRPSARAQERIAESPSRKRCLRDSAVARGAPSPHLQRL